MPVARDANRTYPAWTIQRNVWISGLFPGIAELGLSDIDALHMQLAKIGVKMREGVCRNPSASMERLGMLWDSRQPGETNMRLWIVARGLGSLGCEGENDKEALAWVWLCNHGIGDFCARMIADKGFCDEHPIFIVEILDMYADYLGAILSERREDNWGLDPSVPDTLAVLRRVCDCLWTHRHTFSDEQLDGFCSGSTARLRKSLTKICKKLIYAPEDEPEVKLTLTLARPLALFCWYHSAEVEKSGNEDERSVAALLLEAPLQLLTLAPGDGSAETAEAATRRSKDLTSFIAQDIAAEYGPEKYLMRLRTSFRQPWMIDMELSALVLTAGKTLAHPMLIPHLTSVGMYAVLKEALDRQLLHGLDDSQWTILRQVLRTYLGISKNSPPSEGSGPLIRQGKVIELVARTCRAYSETASVGPGEDRDDVLLETLSRYIDISRAINIMSVKNAVRKALRSSLREEWYPTLAMLRDESLRPRIGKAASKEQLATLTAGWKALGETIGLEDNQEKEDYERRLKRQPQICAWPRCKYHAERAPVALKACKGCDAVRYCSGICQNRDWKNGGHKLRCRRLKDVGM